MNGNNFDGNTVMVDVSQRGISEELNSEVAQYINFFFKQTDAENTLPQYHELLRNKKSRNPRREDYLDSLLVNVAYFIETVDSYVAALQDSLKNNTQDKDYTVKRMKAANDRFRNINSHLAKYRASAPSDADSAEYNYIFYAVYQKICQIAITSLFDNPGIFQSFRSYDTNHVGQLFKDYLYACTRHLLAQPAPLWVEGDGNTSPLGTTKNPQTKRKPATPSKSPKAKSHPKKEVGSSSTSTPTGQSTYHLGVRAEGTQRNSTEKAARVMTKDERRSLIEAAKKGDTAFVEAALDQGADVNTKDPGPEGEEKSSLHWAAELGHNEMASMLLDRGANADIRDDEQGAPIHYAAFHGQTSTLNLLLEPPARCQGKDRDDDKCLDLRAPFHLRDSNRRFNGISSEHRSRTLAQWNFQ